MGQQQGCTKQGRHKDHCQSYLTRGKREANRIRRLRKLVAKAIRLHWSKSFIDQTSAAVVRWEKCTAEYYAKGIKGRTFKLK